MASTSGSALEAPMKVPALITTPLVIVSVVFPFLSFASILIRYKARRLSQQSFQSDDWWIMIAWVTAIGLSINVWVFGAIAGIDYYDINPLVGVMQSRKCLTFASAVTQAPLSAVKISILFLYKRIFTFTKFRIGIWILIALISIWGSLFFILVLLQGDPITAAWTGQGIIRFDSTALGLAQVGSSICIDLLVLCTPIPVIAKLHMRPRRKFAIALILWLGSFCVVSAIVRMILLNEVTQAVTRSRGSGYPAIYLESKQFIFLLIEPNASIIAGCLPCYGPLLKGSRAPDSIIRSTRTFFSTHSLRLVFGNHSKTSDSLPDQSKAVDDEATSRHGSTESQYELRASATQWQPAPEYGQNTVEIGPGRDEELCHFENDVINVTEAIDVTRH